MLKNRSVLPRLDYLLAFEAAAELESFAAAAKELNVSETAVSRKIRLLELHYDCALFVRGHRSVTLTETGKQLLDGISNPLARIARLSEAMLNKTAPSNVRLSATNSVASLWLMPRIHKFQASNPNVSLSLMSSDADEECLSDNFDLTILRGNGVWPGYVAERLFGETVFPVCAPDYLAKSTSSEHITDLSDHALIEVTNNHAEWLNWRTWLDQKGMDPNRVGRTTLLNTYPLAIQAAVDGLGIALGWGHLVDHYIESGKLVRAMGNAHLRTTSGYYLLRREGVEPSTETRAVAQWLLMESARRKRYTPDRSAA